MKKYHVTLTGEERKELNIITKKGKRSARIIRSAYVLLNCDENSPNRLKTDAEIADMLDMSERGVENIRKRFVWDGFEAALYGRKSTQTYEKKIDGDVEAHLVALSCSEPPKGRARWSLRLLADKAIELKYVSSISHESIRQALKKTS